MQTLPTKPLFSGLFNPFGVNAAYEAPAVTRVELVLRLPDGEAWTVGFSPGIERFIGHYPRLDEIAPEGTLLSFAKLREG